MAAKQILKIADGSIQGTIADRLENSEEVQAMKFCRPGIIAGIFLIALGASSTAEIYKWVDEHGVTHYSDSPTSGQLPPDNEAEDTLEAPEKPAEPAAQPAQAAPDPNRQDRQNLMKSITKMLRDSGPDTRKASPAVELYVTDWCPWCKKAEKFFDSEGVDYVVYNVEKNQKARARMNALTKERGVPFAVVNGEKISGYSVAAYRRALKSR